MPMLINPANRLSTVNASRKGGHAGRARSGFLHSLGIWLAALVILQALAAGSGENEGRSAARAAYYELSIDPSNATQAVDPSDPPSAATFSFQIRNTGDSNSPLPDLELSPWDAEKANWSYNFIPSEPFEVKPNDGFQTVILVVYVAPYATAKRYTMQLRGTTGVASNSVTINIDVGQYGAVRVMAPPPQEGGPGETLEFNFTIVNTGNGRDRFKVGNNWTADLSPGASEIKSLDIVIPFDAKTTEGTDGYPLTFEAVSAFNSSCHDSNTTFFRVKHVYELSTEVSPPSATILPGEQAEFSVTVLNMGNGNDRVSLRARAVFPSSSWTISLGTDRLDLRAGRSAVTTLRITPPYNALAGDTYIVEVSARSAGPPGEPVERTEAIHISVLPVKGIIVPRQHFAPPYPVAPGGAVQYSFNFTNSGNAPATVGISVSEAPLGWSAVVEPKQAVAVRAGASAGALLRVIPSARYNESPSGTHLVKVRLSDSDENIVGELSFEIEVAPARGLELEPAGGPAREVNLFVSNRETFLLSLENAGNAPDDVSLALVGDYASWGRFDASVVPVGAGETKVLRLDLTVPKTAATVSIYPLTVRAVSLGRPDLFVERLLFITVKDFDPAELVPRLKVYPQDRALSLTGGDEYAFPVSVLCTGSGIGNVSLRVTGGEGLDLAYKITELPRDLSAGENHTFLVLLRIGGSQKGVTRGTLVIQAVGDGVSAPAQTVSVTLQPAPRATPVVSMEGLGIALAIFLALGGIAVGWNEVVLVALLNLLLPLYVKLRREEVLDQYTRGKIHGYIIANPGEHYNSIKAQLRLKNGTLAYHLRVLEREGYVKTTRDGMFKRFYPMEALVPRRKSEFSAIQEIVLEHIRSAPGTNQNELARRMGVSSQVVNYHIRNLVAAGIIRLEREGRETRCYLSDS